jgi:hypothetical protein
VVQIGPSRPRTADAVHSIAAGIARWQRSIERRRLIALARRGAIVGLLAACLLQLGAIIAGHGGPGPWLVPALVLGLLVAIPGILRRTSPSTAARMLDHDRALGAGVTTALELERGHGAPAHAAPSRLAGLVLADGRQALARSAAEAHVALRPQRTESGLLAALVLALAGSLLVPAGGHGSSARVAVGPEAPTHHTAIASQSDPTRQQAGPDLRQFGQAQPTLPPLNAIAGGTHRGGVPSGTRRSGAASKQGGASVPPASRTAGNAGYLQTARTNGASAASSSSSGANGRTSSTLTSQNAPAARPVRGAGSERANPLSKERAATGRAAAHGIPGRANTRGAGSQRGGASAAGANQTSPARRATPGGATAGNTKGGTSAGFGVVPQLRGTRGLPIQAGYETARSSKGGGRVSAADASGAGGASHSATAGAAAAGAGGAGAVPYVAPGSSTVAPVDRRLLLGYFGSFARVAAAGW